jgi:integrase
LTLDEASNLLHALRKRSAGVHDEALLALFCGLRAGEIFNLTVADIDFSAKTIFLRDTKSGRNRHAYMTGEVEAMLQRRAAGKGQHERLFPATGGGARQWVSQTFDRVVAELELNKGIEDARQRIVFHSLRHTFASWLVQRGTSIYEVAKLMGHSTIRMTERYSHLAPDTVRRAAMGLEGILNQEKAKVIPFHGRAEKA